MFTVGSKPIEVIQNEVRQLRPTYLEKQKIRIELSAAIAAAETETAKQIQKATETVGRTTE